MVARDLDIDISDHALDVLSEAGFDPVYGARPLKRTLQQRLENPLAQRILAGEFSPGQTIQVDEQDGAWTFRAVTAAPDTEQADEVATQAA